MKAKLIGLFVGIALTPVATLFAVGSAGAGHGDYVLACILYPWTMLSTHLTHSTITWIGVSLAGVQFPVYGWFFGAAFRKDRGLAPMMFTTGAHLVAVALTFMAPNGFGR